MGTELQPRATVSGITIDGATSRDLDDAISVCAQEDGILCQVHITDVDAAVPKDSQVDRQAAQRLETIYRSQYNLPMLPRSLSEQQCSLLPGGQRKTISVSWTLARDGSLAVSPHLFLSRFASQQRWTYPQFDQALAEGNAHCKLLQLVAEHLYRLRGGGQALFGRSWDGMGYLDEDGALLHKPFKSQMVVAEFAIAANRFVADYAHRQQIGLLFRNQSASAQQLRSPLVQQLLAIDEPQALRRCLSQSLEVASYGVACDGHFALALDAYCHFTSPIRRYVDLVNHRQLKASLLGTAPPYSLDWLADKAATVNNWREAARERSHQYFKAAAKAEQAAQLAQPQALEQLSAKAFSKLLVTACKAGKLEAIAQEVRQRMTEEKLTLVDKRWILLRGTALELQTQLLNQLSATEAISLLVMQQDDEVIESVDWEFESDDRGWWTRATGQIEGQAMTMPWVLGANKQEAKGNAAIALLEGLLNEALVPVTEAEPFVPASFEPEVYSSTAAVAATAASKTAAPATTASAAEVPLHPAQLNYIGELNTLAQKQGTPPPAYEIVSNGEGGFRATVTWQDWRSEAQGSSKKRAKTAAAQILWQTIDSES